MDIYYVDIDSRGNAHGIVSYTHQYLYGMSSQSDINLNFIWLESTRSSTISSENDGLITHHYLPKLMAHNDNMSWEESIANTLLPLLKKNCIIHLNWISHCSIIHHLKWRIACTVILTKHCIPWRDLITDDYNTFKKIDHCFKAGLSPTRYFNLLVNEEFAYQQVDFIIVLTEIARKSLTTIFSIKSDKIFLIRNGLQFSNMFKDNSKSVKTLRNKYHFKKNERIIIFVGTISVRKGIIDLLEAFKLILENSIQRNERLVIIGSGDYSLLLKYPSIASRIILTGILTKDLLSEFYSIASVGVVPSYVEQCSYTAIEMMLSKVPIVASAVDGLKEMISEKNGYPVKFNLINTFNPSVDHIMLKDRILEVLNNPDISKQKSTRAYDIAVNQHSLEEMITKTVRVYKKSKLNIRERQSYKLQVEVIKVSVLLPVFNGEKYIAESIKSVLNQTFTNFELIIIDDGSTDSTVAIINEFNDCRIKLLRNKVKKGISYSLNRGIKDCNSKYTARLDADDMMMPNRLHEQISFLENNSEYVMVGSGYYLMDEFGKHIKKVQPITNYEDILILLLFANQFAHSTIMISTEVLKDFKYSDKYPYCEDYDLWLRLAQNYKIKNILGFLTKYRIHEQNVSNIYSKSQMINSISLVAESLTKFKIDFSITEFKIHAAIMQKSGSKYFTSGANLFLTLKWLDKILDSPLIKSKLSYARSEEIKDYISAQFCFCNSLSIS